MKKTIYNVYVPMESQEQCDRMKQLCIDYGLPYSNIVWHFNFNDNKITNSIDFGFLLVNFNLWCKPTENQVTEQEFIELLKI